MNKTVSATEARERGKPYFVSFKWLRKNKPLSNDSYKSRGPGLGKWRGENVKFYKKKGNRGKKKISMRAGPGNGRQGRTYGLSANAGIRIAKSSGG